MPIEIKLTKLPAGYAENSGRAGDKMLVSLRGFFSSEDGNELIVRLEGFPQELISVIPSKAPILPSMVNSLLALIRRDETAIVYLNSEVKPIASARIRGGCKAGDPILTENVLDFGRVKFEGIDIPSDVGIVYVFSVGWRRGLYYDFAPLHKDIDRLPEYDVEELVGGLYAYLFFMNRFQISDSTWTNLFQQKWFPFAYLGDSRIKKIISSAKNNWDIDKLLPEIADNVERLLKENNPINRSSPYISEHAVLFDQAVERYLAKDYISCASILYPRIEGLMRTFHRTERYENAPYAKNLSHTVTQHHQEKRIKNSLLLPRKFEDYLNEVYFANFTPGTSPDTGRHSVAHGEARAADFDLKSSTIGFLIIFQLTLFFSDGTKGRV